MIITFISDTHTKHDLIEDDLAGGDLLIHAGDIMNSGYDFHDITDFGGWYDEINNYTNKVFIAGNHYRKFQNDPNFCRGILTNYKTIDYLEDEWMDIDGVKLYGSPWQPEFYNWAFNLPRNGEELKSKWDAIPNDTDILITHGPAFGYLDDVEGRRGQHLGCELLIERIKEIKPKIHVCGHIHSGYGYYFDGHTHFINASILDERYNYTQLPQTIDWNPITNEIEWI